MLKLDQRIAEARQKFKKTGHTHHLVHERNMRVNFGQRVAPPQSQYEKIKPGDVPNPFPGLKNDIPEMEYKDVTSDILTGAIIHHGALIVRNFFGNGIVENFRKGIDETFYESSKHFALDLQDKPTEPIDERSPWFRRQLPGEKLFDPGSVGFMLMTGSVWTFLSPAVCHDLLKSFEDVNLRGLLDEYFDDRTCLSFNKSVLRRMDPLGHPADWHQDGAFMDEHIKSINLWVALSDCGAGTDCPGMDFVPKRLNKIMPTGINKAKYDWSVSHESVSEWFKDCPPVTPTYKAGDAIFFDHYNLHVTSYSPEYTKRRYALETWFFAQKHAASNQSPMYW